MQCSMSAARGHIECTATCRNGNVRQCGRDIVSIGENMRFTIAIALPLELGRGGGLGGIEGLLFHDSIETNHRHAASPPQPCTAEADETGINSFMDWITA